MEKKKINRRNFLKLAAAGLAGGCVAFNSYEALAQRMRGGGGGMGGGGGGGGGGGTTIIDPPPGLSFRDPVAMPQIRNNNIVDVNLEPMISSVNVNGNTANLMTYNGSFPAPTIQVTQGDILRIHFTNSLPYAGTNMLGFQRGYTNLHTHGWHVSPEEPADAAHLSIAPGTAYDYNYDLSTQDGGTFNFYHPHYHGLVAEQYWAGLVGALIVEDEVTALASFETHTLILKDISLSGTEPEPHVMMMDYMHGKEGDTVMVNGQVNPVLTVRPGQVQRWRVLNASNARFYKLSLQNHTMQLVGTDGGLLDKPYARSQILLSPGERADVLVKASSTKGSYKLLALPYARQGAMSSAQVTLMTLSVQGSSSGQAIPSSIDPSARRLNIDLSALPNRTLALSMGQGRGYINGQDFDVDPYTIMSELGTYEVWTVVNQSGMDHPFHQHVNAAQVLSIGSVDSAYPPYASLPAWKDTVLVPKWGSVTLLVPVQDWPGMTMFHCHILEHEDIGMIGMWHIMGMG